MAKPISKSSLKIIALLKKGVTANQVSKKFPKNTVLYYKRKLFFPEKHARFLAQVRRYQAKKIAHDNI